MLTSGDIIEVYLGAPQGSEAGLTRPVIAVTAQRILVRSPSVIQVVPLTRTIRGYATAVTITADDHNGLDARRAHRPGMLHLGGLCPLLPDRN
jgi:mRNA interferase MazF